MNDNLTLRERYTKARQEAVRLVEEYKASPSTELAEKANEAIRIATEIDQEIASHRTADEFKSALGGLSDLGDEAPARVEEKARTLGEHAVKELGSTFERQTAGAHTEGSASEFKEASDPAKVPTNLVPGWGTTYERSIVNARRERLVVADLMGSATMTNPTLQYLVEKENSVAEGGFATVAEGAKKPYIRFDEFDVVTESLSKIAALTKLTDEMVSDFTFIADWINHQLIYELSVAEEKQLLNGDGSGTNVRGLLNRSGLQTATSANKAAWFDDIFKAIQSVPQATNFEADGIMVNPGDYSVLRLTKDGNGQYYAGGPFQGSYGQGGIMQEPPLWGLRTVVTNAVPKGTAVLGAFRQAATVLRKGGVRVDSTNTNVDDFERNLVTLRAEERVGLMVTVPSAFVKLTLNEG